jgi:hypothetical protein
MINNSTAQKPNKYEQRTQPAWDTMHQGLSVSFGNCNLPKNHLNKSGCVAALSSLPSHPTLQQTSEAASAFQFRKVLGGKLDKAAAFKDLKEVLSTAPPPLLDEAKHAIRTAVGKLFPLGWDRRYEYHVEQCVPSLAANLEGIAPGSFAKEGLDDITFRGICAGILPPLPIPARRRCTIFSDCGKPRAPTIPSFKACQLKPVHLTIYERMTREGTILRGPPTSTNMSAFTLHPVEEFVSGDYKGATNRFNSNATRYAMECLQKSSTFIPPSIWEAAISFMKN